MRSFPRHALLLAAAFGLAACDGTDSRSFDITDYTGNAYTGQVSLDIERPDGTGQETTYNGTARFTHVPGAEGTGAVTLVVDVDAPDADPLTFTGTYDEDGMRFTLPGTAATFTVRDGDVSGSGEVLFFDTTLDVTADGTITPSRIDATFDAEIVEGGTAETPNGTTATLALDMNR